MDFAPQFLEAWGHTFGNKQTPPILTCLKGNRYSTSSTQSEAVNEEIHSLTLKSVKLRQELRQIEFVADFLEHCQQELNSSADAVDSNFNVMDDNHGAPEYDDVYDSSEGKSDCNSLGSIEDYLEELENKEKLSSDSDDLVLRSDSIELRKRHSASLDVPKRMTLTQRISRQQVDTLQEFLQQEESEAEAEGEEGRISWDAVPPSASVQKKTDTYPQDRQSRKIRVMSDLYDSIAHALKDDEQSLASTSAVHDDVQVETESAGLPRNLPSKDVAMLTERKSALTRILADEKSHVEILRVLDQYHKALLSGSSDQSQQDTYRRIFFNIPQLLNAQQKFVRAMEVRLSDGFEPSYTQIHDLIYFIVTENVFFDYLDNVQSALQACELAGKNDKNFQLYLSRKIAIAHETDGNKLNAKTHYSIQDLIALPMKWLITHAENIKSLLTLTPENHVDHQELHKALDQLLKSIGHAASGMRFHSESTCGIKEEGEEAQTQAQSNLERKGSLLPTVEGRQLVMERFLVEISAGRRKLRRVFLFTDVLVCGKPKLGSGNLFVEGSEDQLDATLSEDAGRCEMEIKWFIALHNLALHKNNPAREEEADKDSKKSREAVKQLKVRIRDLRAEIRKLRNEIRDSGAGPEKERATGFGFGLHRSSTRSSGSSSNLAATDTEEFSFLRRNNPHRRLEKKEEELGKLQGELLLMSQNKPLSISWMSSHGNKVEKRFLLGSELERNEWLQAIQRLHTRCLNHALGGGNVVPVTMDTVRSLVTRHNRNTAMNNLGYAVLTSSSRPPRPAGSAEECGLNGMLQVVVHRLEGPSDLERCFVSVELDSLGQFTLFAKTTPVQQGAVDESFEIPVDGSETTIRFVVHRAAQDCKAGPNTVSELDEALGKLDLRLTSEALHEYKEKGHSVSMASDPEEKCLLVLSLIFEPAGLTLKRQKTKLNHAIFGISLQQYYRRFTRKGEDPVPDLVTFCLQEIETRGIKEAGVYRISPSRNEVTALCRRLENANAAHSTWKRLLGEVDVHVITHVLKKFFRELTDPLFTAERYPKIREAFEIKQEDDKVAQFQQIIDSLPEPNRSTAATLCHHLITVSAHDEDNRMTLNNLALIFGPTLLSPPPTGDALDPPGGLAAALKETSILLYILKQCQMGLLFVNNE